MAVFHLVIVHFLQADIEAHLTHHGHVGTELDRGILVPASHVGAHCLCREELGESPLDIQTLDRIGVVAAPEFREIFQSLVITAGTPTGAKHDR